MECVSHACACCVKPQQSIGQVAMKSQIPYNRFYLLILAIIAISMIGCDKISSIFDKSDGFVVAFDQSMTISQEVSEIESYGIKIKKRLTIINGISCNLDDEEKQLVQSLKFVRYVEPDVELYKLEDKSFGQLLAENIFSSGEENIDWGLKRINAPEAWDIATGKGVKVGIMDTGINSRHPDLVGAVAGGYDAVNGKSYEDDNNHGTYVASVVAARKNGVGIVGVAPDAMLYAVKVMNSDGSGYISDILDGCQWVIKEDIKLVNMSFGSSYQSMAIQEAMNKLASSKVIVISASGNEGKLGVYSPARNKVTVCVGGSGMDDKRAAWSNYGPELRENGVLAPGDWIQVANKDGKWQRVSGTSIATPHVTGMAALMLELKCDDPELVRKFIFMGASQPDNTDDFIGHGIVNAKKTLDILSNFQF
jgi:subtilisin